MSQMSAPIAGSLKRSDFIVPMVTADLTDEIANRRARGTEGASIAWILGHLCHYRYEIMKLLGEDAESPFAEQFAVAEATDGAGYPTIGELVQSWREVSERLLPVVEAATDEALTRSRGEGKRRVLDMVVFFAWHEAYHLGQLGTLRAQFGLTPTATLAKRARAARA